MATPIEFRPLLAPCEMDRGDKPRDGMSPTVCRDRGDDWLQMTDEIKSTDACTLTLLRLSLATWGIAATITSEPDGRWLIKPDGQPAVRICRAPIDIPFRWLLTTGAGRERPASSVTGLLRILRSTLDPGWQPGRARVLPLTPPVS